jgi:hypothetical protein
MTSQINFGAIDITFPVPGQDNDSNGFRQNFAAIQSGLEQAKSEITDLQAKAVLTETLGETTETVANNLNGSTIYGGLYRQMNGVVPNDGLIIVSDGNGDIDLDLGPFQVIKITTQDATLRFTNWGADPVQYNSVKVHLCSDGSSKEVTFGTENAGTVVLEDTMSGLTLPADAQVHTVIEAWTYDGTTVFVRQVGTFTIPV